MFVDGGDRIGIMIIDGVGIFTIGDVSVFSVCVRGSRRREDLQDDGFDSRLGEKTSSTSSFASKPSSSTLDSSRCRPRSKPASPASLLSAVDGVSSSAPSTE